MSDLTLRHRRRRSVPVGPACGADGKPSNRNTTCPSAVGRAWRVAVLTLGSVCFLPAWRPMSPWCLAQVTGRVVAADNESPIAGALAELWSDSGLQARGTSDDGGNFRLTRSGGGHALWLLVRRIGFAPTELHAIRDGDFYTVRIRQLPVRLPELDVTSCSNGDDQTSRRLWEVARLRYRLIPDTLAVYASVAYTSADVTSIDSIGTTSRRVGEGTGGWTGLGSRPWRRILSQRGYAVARRPGTYFGAEQGATEYMRLDDHDAEHFVDSLFGAMHLFQPAHEEDALIVIPFCPRSTRRADIEGALSVVPGGGLASAWWRFVVPGAVEEAGGQVFFAPPPDSGASFAIPVRGVFWRRRTPTSQYYQLTHVYDRWGSGADWPFRQH